MSVLGELWGGYIFVKANFDFYFLYSLIDATLNVRVSASVFSSISLLLYQWSCSCASCASFESCDYICAEKLIHTYTHILDGQKHILKLGHH